MQGLGLRSAKCWRMHTPHIRVGQLRWNVAIGPSGVQRRLVGVHWAKRARGCWGEMGRPREIWGMT